MNSTSIRELAQRSGVSIATVSRALNGYPDVNADTRQRILDLARELDYAPSAAARTLVTQRSQLVGVVLETGDTHPDILHPVFQEVLDGLRRRAGLRGYDLLLFAGAGASAHRSQHSYLQRSRHRRLDGVVLLGVGGRDPEVAKLLRSRIPCVAVDIDVVGSSARYVMSDNQAGGRLAVEHLRDLGHTRIATMTGPMDSRPGQDRLLGYASALESAGLPYREEWVQHGDWYPEAGERAMRALLEADERPTAVFACSDLMAIGALRALEAAGLRAPEDVALVGFDDIQMAALTRPALTTVRQDKEALGEAAADALVGLIEGDDDASPAPVILPVELIVRESSGAQAAEVAA